jgi:DNA repair exonuclease SbcCD ATPase subunit
VWIERLDIRGFRSLAGSFTFSNGVNVIVGENEAGKSTLHDALIRSLYGFTSAERRRYRNRSVRDDCRPWNGNPFGLVAAVRDVGGRDYRIEWDFDAHAVRLFDGGVDCSAQVEGKGGDVALGEFLLGTGVDDFRQVCCLDHGDVEAVRHSPSLGLALQEAVAQIGGDVAAKEVVARLESWLREQIGVRVDTLAPTQRGRLTALLCEREEVADAIREEEEVRERMVELGREMELNESEYQRLVASSERLRQRLYLSERRELERRLEEAQRLGEAATATAVMPRVPSQQVLDRIRGAEIRLEELADVIAGGERQVADMAVDVERLEDRERHLDARLIGLETYANVDDSARNAVQRLWGELDGLEHAPLTDVTPAPQADPVLASYRAERQDLYAMQAGVSRLTWRRVAWSALVVVTLGLAMLVRKLIRKLRGQQADCGGLGVELARYDASSLAELDARVADEDRRLAATEARAALARSQAAERESRAQIIEGELVAALDVARAPSATTLEARASAYLDACERHSQHVATALERERVRNELQQLRRPKQDLRDNENERLRLVGELNELYIGAGIQTDDLDEANLALAALLSRAESAERANQEAASAAQALTSVLAGGTVADLELQLASARHAHDEHVARWGTLATEGGDKQQLERQLAALQHEAADTRDRLVEAQTRMAALEERIGRSAELKEQRADLDRRILQLEQARDAIKLARDVIREAAEELNRHFQPHLREALTNHLPSITGGRYHEAQIDDALQVQVVVPGLGRQVHVDQLSRATRDQIFLVQRLEVARLLAPTSGSAPLLLDDPFAHYDSKRLRLGLELLTEAAEERQVFIFSEDENLATVATEIRGLCNVINLPAPVPRVPAESIAA